MPTVSLSLDSNYRTEITARGHTLTADEPESSGGGDAGPTPTELLCAAVGSCMAVTMKLYADRKKWPLEGVDITVEMERVKAEECAECEITDGRTHQTVIRSRMRLRGPLTGEQRIRIAEIGGRCPVHRTVEEGAFLIDELEVE